MFSLESTVATVAYEESVGFRVSPLPVSLFFVPGARSYGLARSSEHPRI